MRTTSFWLFVAVGYAELLTLVLIGDSTVTLAGAIGITAFVVWLGRGSRAAWWIFVIITGVLLLSTLAVLLSSGGHILWGDVITIIVGSVIELALLLRPELRRPAAQLA